MGEYYCFAERLQKAFVEKCPEAATKFDFNVFLANYSSAVYEPFILFLSVDRKRIKGFTQKSFNQCLPQQCRSTDLPDNGVGVTNGMKVSFAQFDPLKLSSGFDIESEKLYYGQLGLTESNAYLHIRGHHLSNLVKNIGQQLCSGMRVNFEDDILLDSISLAGYWEIENLGLDILSF